MLHTQMMAAARSDARRPAHDDAGVRRDGFDMQWRAASGDHSMGRHNRDETSDARRGGRQPSTALRESEPIRPLRLRSPGCACSLISFLGRRFHHFGGAIRTSTAPSSVLLSSFARLLLFESSRTMVRAP
jgi:hypothetical protein